jgi:5-methylcytosine-specific restriction protein A
MRQHHERGIVGSATIRSDVYQDLHWDGSGREANYADLDWKCVLDIDARLPVERLRREIPELDWDRLQGSGVRVSTDPVAYRLQALWDDHLTSVGLGSLLLAEEVGQGVFTEGAVSEVRVNRYERDPGARKACLAHWGYDCQVCGLNFQAQYGDLAKTSSTSIT